MFTAAQRSSRYIMNAQATKQLWVYALSFRSLAKRMRWCRGVFSFRRTSRRLVGRAVVIALPSQLTHLRASQSAVALPAWSSPARPLGQVAAQHSIAISARLPSLLILQGKVPGAISFIVLERALPERGRSDPVQPSVTATESANEGRKVSASVTVLVFTLQAIKIPTQIYRVCGYWNLGQDDRLIPVHLGVGI